MLPPLIVNVTPNLNTCDDLLWLVIGGDADDILGMY